jgi:hypothetical protein
MKPTVSLSTLVQTTTACPAQWEAVDCRGYIVYARYRFGYLTVRCAQTEATLFDSPPILDVPHGQSLDGRMDTAEMLTLTGEAIEWVE